MRTHLKTLPADQHPALLGEEGEGDPQPLDGAVQREKQGPHLVLEYDGDSLKNEENIS